jgi:hypothetical protein
MPSAWHSLAANVLSTAQYGIEQYSAAIHIFIGYVRSDIQTAQRLRGSASEGLPCGAVLQLMRIIMQSHPYLTSLLSQFALHRISNTQSAPSPADPLRILSQSSSPMLPLDVRP